MPYRLVVAAMMDTGGPMFCRDVCAQTSLRACEVCFIFNDMHENHICCVDSIARASLL